MTSRKIVVHTPGKKSELSEHNHKSLSPKAAAHLHRLEVLDSRQHRSGVMHWLAMLIALASLGILIFAMVAFRRPVPTQWVFLDVAICIFFFFEFFTRSGLRWHGLKYARTHIFDFIAIVPVLLFLHHGVFIESLWVWLVLVARSIRAFDRILGDGFLEHNFFGLLEGLETEITDKVVLRIMDRVQNDLVSGKIGHSSAQVLEKNRDKVLRRVRAEYPQDGLGADLARFIGLEAAIERIEERIYDSIADVLNSSEVDTVIQEDLDLIFDGLRADLGNDEWRNHLGFQHVHKHNTHNTTEQDKKVKIDTPKTEK
jgi:hypothetical protein